MQTRTHIRGTQGVFLGLLCGAQHGSGSTPPGLNSFGRLHKSVRTGFKEILPLGLKSRRILDLNHAQPPQNLTRASFDARDVAFNVDLEGTGSNTDRASFRRRLLRRIYSRVCSREHQKTVARHESTLGVERQVSGACQSDAVR